jgi:hypothetical protein
MPPVLCPQSKDALKARAGELKMDSERTKTKRRTMTTVEMIDKLAPVRLDSTRRCMQLQQRA